ncbi:MAG: pentapeptide repeat-containing protein [Oscillatoriales cyanobacterium RM2_1_1]|nr:pentapeptide repeat-containing protein [Oscillatoriales cyanobacterium SM2_3_0]NJO47283.1 pentapeptide repeat-containing protein [Oscillatoriales cyanobacterium RM2_1_1]
MKIKLKVLFTTLSKVAAGAAFITLACFASTPVHAGNPEHLKQLLETGACPGCDLSGFDLQEAHLIGADLREADLSEANLENANLEGADLKGANLRNTNLAGTFLNSAELNEANLTLANLTDANLVQARLSGADLTNANLEGSTLIARPLEEIPQPPRGSARNLTESELSISRDLRYLVLPLGGPDLGESFEYSQDYLDQFFRPLNANPEAGDRRPQLQIFPLGEGNTPSGPKTPGFIRF